MCSSLSNWVSWEFKFVSDMAVLSLPTYASVLELTFSLWIPKQVLEVCIAFNLPAITRVNASVRGRHDVIRGRCRCLAKGDSAKEFVPNGNDGSTWNVKSDQVAWPIISDTQ
jgi:hypothetical protein